MPTLNGTTERTTVQPAPLPVNLDQRLDLHRAGFSIAGLLIGAVLFMIGAGLWSWGTRTSMEYRGAGGWTLTITGGGLALAGAGVFVLAFWYLASIVRYEMQARWLWTRQSISERQDQGGLIIEEERTDWSLRVDEPRDMLLILIYIYLEVRAGKRTPWSIDNLTGSLFLGDERQKRLLGTVSEHQARAVGRELTRLGLVQNRAEKSAGQWAARNADELIERFMRGM